MAKYVGGDMLEITCSHPEHGDFRFDPKANESFTLNKGGVRTNDDANSVTSNGTIIQQKNNTLWNAEGPIAVDMEGEQSDYLNKVTASSELGTWVFTHISGAVYTGKGIPVGDLSEDTNTAQQTLKIAGSGKLSKIS